MREIVVALAGNPNAGKTTVFNALTGARQHVGNYPGVTVEKKEGMVDRGDIRFRIVDLPGTYSLSAASPEEVVARDFLIRDKPDVVVQVVDASNLERNLFLTTQLMELGVKLVIALNMVDVAKTRGLEFDMDLLSSHLRSSVVPTVGNKSRGVKELLDAVRETADGPLREYEEILYPRDLARAIDDIDCALQGPDREHADKFPPRWLAGRLFEDDADVVSRISDLKLLAKVEEMRRDFERENEDPPEIRAAEAKYGWISGLTAEAMKLTPQARSDLSDKVDTVILHRVLGLPIFLALMYIMFQLVFTLAEPPMEWIEAGFAHLGGWVAGLWPKSADSPLRDLLVDGVINGVGGVLVFLPNIVLLFLVIAFLEGTGYMARAAFIMDHFMHRIGLHGKSFIPMLLGFGCTVPAIMATRTLENTKDRLTTILVLPFMSCGARLPIYALIIPAFFPEHLRASMLWLIYVIGIVFAIIGAKLLRNTVFKGDTTTFVMELPPYRMPTVRSVVLLMWERAWEYCKKAGTIILGVSILLWAMTAYPKKETFERAYDDERAAVTLAYNQGAADLGERAGLGAGGALLSSWVAEDEARREGEAGYWKHEPGHAAALETYQRHTDALYGQPGGDRLREFLDGVGAVDNIEDAMAEATEDEEEDSEAYREAAAARRKALANLSHDPELLRAAVEFREQVRDPYRESLEEINNAEAGEQLAYSISGRIGHFLEPVMRPLGFDWRIATAIIGSFAAKEVFVAQMGIVYSVGEADEGSDTLREKLRDNYTPLQAFCMMLWCLLSVPCVATIAVTRREAGGWRYAIAMLVGYTVVAYVTTFIVFQVGSMLGLGI